MPPEPTSLRAALHTICQQRPQSPPAKGDPLKFQNCKATDGSYGVDLPDKPKDGPGANSYVMMSEHVGPEGRFLVARGEAGDAKFGEQEQKNNAAGFAHGVGGTVIGQKMIYKNTKQNEDLPLRLGLPNLLHLEPRWPEMYGNYHLRDWPFELATAPSELLKPIFPAPASSSAT